MSTITPFLFLFLLINFISIPSFSCPLNQKQALLNIKSNITASFNVSPSYPADHPFHTWSPNSDCCSWNNVFCSKTGNIIYLGLLDLWPSFVNPTSLSFNIFTPLFHIRSLEQLDISYNHLVGEIPGDGFGNLTQLVYLDMSWNNLNGSIPDQIFRLPKLRYLNMKVNWFEGSLGPELGSFWNFNSSLLEIDLSYNKLNGVLSPEVGKLQNLELLDLSENSLMGNIPEEIGNLTKLKRFNLGDNQFSGGIPASIANMKDLGVLDFSYNQLNVPLPSSIQNLSNLRALYLQDNKLTGEIPTWIFNITTLKSLFLGGGKENKWIWNNKAKIVPRCSLVDISLPSCGISGQIPEWISSNKGLISLDLRRNKLEGKVPYWLAEMDLEIIILFDNKLTGSIPPRLFESTRLGILHLSRNNFSGELPDNIGNATQMVGLLLSENNFSGEIPMSMYNMHNLMLLDLSRNKFSSSDIHVFSSYPDLVYLDLSHNEFSGKIPTFFTKVEILYLGGNKFSGPCNFTELVNLQHLDLHDNDITGYIQDVLLPHSPLLQVLVLRNNSFEGIIPTTIFNFTNLQILDLSKNKLTGSIPLEIANLTRMVETPVHKPTSGYYPFYYDTERTQSRIDIGDLIVNWKNDFQGLSSHSLDIYSLLDLSNNRISGEIPASLGNLKSLKALNISNNIISGHIPVSFGDLKGIESLDLSHNKISGSIPKSLEKLDGLGILDVSNNRLTGKIPMGGHMSTMNELKYFANNSGLCGMQINITCPEDIPPIEGREEAEDDEQLSWIFWVGTWIGFPIGFFSSIVIMGYFLNFLLLFKLW